VVGGFLGVGAVLVGIAEDVGGAGDDLDLDLGDVGGGDGVLLDALHHGGEGGVGEGLDREGLHAAVEDAVVVARPWGEFVEQMSVSNLAGSPL
jgi:hypothetical protein